MAFTFKLSKRLAHSRAFTPRLVAAALLLAGCADSVGTSPSSDPSTFDSAAGPAVATVTVSPGTASGTVGQTAQFTAVALDAGGNVLTGRKITWSTTNSAVVAVNGTGFATAIGGGFASIQATTGGVTGRAKVTVAGTKIVVASVTLAPAVTTLGVGATRQFVATVKDTSGATITAVPVSWRSNNIAVATVDSNGLAKAIAAGSADIIATAGGISGRATLTATAATASPVGSVTVSPGSASGSVGQSAQFSAVVKDTLGNVLTDQAVTWSSTNTAVVSVTAGGMGTAVGAGSAAIVATAGGKSGQSAITVTGGTTPPPGTPATVTVTPGSISDSTGHTTQLSAVVKDAAGTVLTGQTIAWSSSAPLVASVSGSGMVTALTTGSTTITASTSGVSGTSTVTVNAGITPPPPPGGEPVFQAGQNLIWKDTFDGVLSDAAVLANYITLNPQFIHADNAAGLNGGGALRFDWQASTGCQDQSRLIEQGIAPTREIYVSYSVRYTPNFQFDWRNYSGCTGNAKKLFFLYSVSGSRFDFISENHWLGMGSDYDHPLFAQNQGTTVSDEQLGDGSWHRITIHVLQSSTPTATDGIIEGWIDGVQRWSYRNVASNASGGWNYFHFPSTFNQGSPATQSEWVDNLTVWKP